MRFGTENIKKWLRSPKIALKLGLILGMVGLFGLIFSVLAIVYYDNFESYDLGILAPQSPKWDDFGTNKGLIVVDDNKYTGLKATKGFYDNQAGSYGTQYLYDADQNNDLITIFMFKQSGGGVDCNNSNLVRLMDKNNGVIGGFDELKPATICYARYFNKDGYTNISTAIFNEWFYWSIEWKREINKNWLRFNFNGGGWTDWKEGLISTYPVKKVDFNVYRRSYVYFDDFMKGEPPTNLIVWVEDPESGSTITDIEDTFTLKWKFWDFEDIWKDFVFSFFQKDTGILVGTKIFEPPTASGEKTYAFSDFGIDKNGDYNFHAKARSYWAIEYPVYYTGDLVDPAWWVKIDIEGWEMIFEMPEFEAWYNEHSKFATATPLFVGIVGLASPVFNKIGEFGNRVISFLNVDEAYDRGYDLGKIIPTFRHYIAEIEEFFGGFPIIQLFLIFLIVLIGIFIVRLILKFIPFLG